MQGNFKATRIQEYLRQIDWVAYISMALICGFGITLLTSYYFPIYSDEIQARFWLSRLPYDFPEKISGTPPCWSSFFQPVPMTMYLPGVINWALHGRLESMPALRLMGVFLASLWVSVLACYLGIKTKSGLEQENNGNPLSCRLMYLYVAGFIIAIFSVGVFPIFLVTNRGEQLIAPSVVVLLSIFIASDRIAKDGHLWKKMGLIVLYFVAVSLVIYGHAKGLFLTPLFIVVGWKLFSRFNSWIPMAIATTLLGLHITQCLSAYKYAFQCGEMPWFEEMIKSYSFDPASLFYDPNIFFDRAYHSLINFPKYLNQLGFQPETDANYLPPLPITASANIANFFIKLNTAIIFFTMLLFLPYQYYRKAVISGRFITVNLALLTLFWCVMISALFNIPKNWYDAGYIYALLLVVAVFFIGENYCTIIKQPASRKFIIYLGAAALLSQAVFISRNLPAFLNGYIGPGVSIAKYDSGKTADDLASASRACGIDPVHSEKLVVDDYTYLYFQKSKWPMATSYIWFLPDDKSIREFFSQVDSDGLIVNCTGILSPYMSVVKREGNICCIPKNELKNLLNLPL